MRKRSSYVRVLCDFDFELLRRSSVIGPGRKKKPSTVNETQVTLKLGEQSEFERSNFFINSEVFGGKMDNKTDNPLLGFVEARSVTF